MNRMNGRAEKTETADPPFVDPLFQLRPPVPCIQLLLRAIVVMLLSLLEAERVLAGPASATVQ